ncbi:26S proteasome non-ATPase regulatory subunit 6 AltName: Full=26S proteasome regulatory subunit RPN7 [Rhizoctonia solani AG-1 IB]|uniref:PSMD6 protein n=1 Tax=Thanatephorus cucumeris (strain AG1-IB / isolate 7/3/14) TaxID=1108050 RepID=M5CGA5_THACB|nr:26S proteasome non-ATPase regulatory subunit 6 AltName: Full=26S proteasome regulatory subunit RPN7 [Rhizoctonia solani AG-1 IB]
MHSAHFFAAASRKALADGIKADEMAPYARLLAIDGLIDEAAIKELETKNKEELEKLDVRLKEAEETEGETEISDALRAKASYLTRIGDKDRAVAAQALALEKTPGLGSRIDIALTLVRIGIFFGDRELVTENLSKAESLVDQGGDWDRRNRLKVYRGIHLLSIRQFKRASELLLDSLSTFTASELVDYNQFVVYCVVCGTLVLSRPELKKRILSSPEVNQVMPEISDIADYTSSLYECQYAKFFQALASLEQTHLLPSRLLSPHARFYVREMRILAYAQLLESYRSLTMESLAGAFGVSVEFVDRDLSRFIASNRLNCTIDAVRGVVETTRPSTKNAQYETVIRTGDVLLNEVQKLSRVLC